MNTCTRSYDDVEVARHSPASVDPSLSSLQSYKLCGCIGMQKPVQIRQQCCEETATDQRSMSKKERWEALHSNKGRASLQPEKGPETKERKGHTKAGNSEDA